MGKEQIRLVVVLTLISAIAGGILAIVNNYTEPKIKEQNEIRKKQALQECLSASKFMENQDMLSQINNKNISNIKEIYVGYKEEDVIGLVMVVGSQGYSSQINLMIGVTKDREISGIKVLNQSETPGLGTRITEEEFINQASIMTSSINNDLALIKDGGKVEAVTGATVSSRAVIRGINEVLTAARLVLNSKLIAGGN